MLLRAFVSVVLTVFGCNAYHAFAQLPENKLAFETINDKKGITHHNITSLFQDRRGFIWMGTEYGLNRYNGVKAVSFFAKPGEENALPSNYINKVTEDQEGFLWIGTRTGITKMDPVSLSMTSFFHEPTAADTLKSINFSVFPDGKGGILAGNGFKLLHKAKTEKEFRVYPFDGGQSTGNTRNYFLLDVLPAKDNGIWLATSYGVKKFYPATGQYKSYHFGEKKERLTENAVASLAYAPDGKLFAGTWGSGLLVYNDSMDRFELMGNPMGLSDGDMAAMVLDIIFREGQIYLATVRGLWIGKYPECMQAGKAYLWKQFQASSNQHNTLPGSICNQIMFDHDGSLWVGTNNYAARANLRISRFQHQPIRTALDQDIYPSALLSGTSTAKQAGFWMGSRKLYFVETQKGSIQEIDLGISLESPFYTGAVWDITKGKNYVWVATTSGLFAFNPEVPRKVLHYPYREGEVNSLAGQRLWRVFEDKSGKVWIATIRRGLTLFNPGDKSFRNFFTNPKERATLFNITPTDFFEDRSGDIWVGGKDFLYRYHSGEDSFSVYEFSVKNRAGILLTGKPRPFYEDDSGAIWVAFESGIASFNPKEKRFEDLMTNVPFFRPEGDIVHVKNECWFGTNLGLFRLEMQGLKLTRFTTRDGLFSNDTEACLGLLPDGTLLIGHQGMMTRFNPAALTVNSKVPPVALEAIRVNGTNYIATQNEPARFPFRSTLQFDFAALSFDNAEQNQYSFKLEGADKDWSSPSPGQAVTYASLPPGSYTFLLKGSNCDGIWNPKPVTFSFVVMAPFYRQGWFVVLGLIVTGSAIYLFYRYRLQQALKIERLRTRLATDLHDDVGATLSAISMYADALKKQTTEPGMTNLLGKMGEDSREMVRTMSDLVWAINPRNDSGQKLIGRIENLALDLCAAAGVKLSFNNELFESDEIFGIELRRNIFLIFKEAVNNALKYSGCSELTVTASVKEGRFTLEICDNGCGFDPLAVQQGNGLENMKLRAGELKGELSIQTSYGKGCCISLKCPV